jgi:hypothetical protein
MFNLNYKLLLLVFTMAIGIGCFGFVGTAKAEYESAGTSTSANLLSGLDVRHIRSFYYNVSSLPEGTTLKFRYSTTSASGPWVNSAGTPNGWDTVASAGTSSISLGDFYWSECPFYYQARFESDPNGQYSPVLDLIKIRFFPPNPFTIEGEVIFNNIDIKTVLPEEP